MSHHLQSFVKAVEVWIPDGDLLQRRSGAYGPLTAFERASVELTLRKGQGLPGAAWSTLRPHVWTELGARFVRADLARAAGFDAAVAVPLFDGSQMSSVVVFLCGSRAQTGGCIEVWEPNERDLLALADGYYGRLESFEKVSRTLELKRGQGLPGVVWETGLPRIMYDLATSGAFVRASAARENGLGSGLGFPVYCGGAMTQVMLFLSAESTPLARAFEVWSPNRQGKLQITQSYYSEGLAGFAAHSATITLASGEDLPGRVFESGLPLAVDCARTRLFARRESASRVGLECAVAIPVDDGNSLPSVVVMLC